MRTYTVTYRTTNKSVDSILVEANSLSSILGILEYSKSIVSYKVGDGFNSLTQELFGWGDYEKWVKVLFPENTIKINETNEVTL